MAVSLIRGWSYALRSLRRAPGFAAATIVILGLGIGMATAMFSIFQSALLRRLPILEQDRVVVLWPVGKGGTEVPLGAPESEQLRTTSRTLTDVAGFGHWGAVDAAISADGQPRRLRQALVSTNFFSVLGASPVLGRLLQPSDREADHLAVISYGTWQRLYGGDPAVIGKRLEWLPTGWSYTIVGVAPAGLDYPIGTEVWMPVWPGMPIDLVGRLKPGATVAAARAELAALVADDQARNGNRNLVGAYAGELPDVIYGDVRPVVLVMTAAAGLLLLIACTNVGNLLLLRAAGRAREIAIRRALGASRADIFRQLLAESATLGGLGGFVGLGVAVALLRVFVAIAPRDLPRVEMVRLTGAPLLVAIAVTFATVLLTGLAPLISAGRSDIEGPLLRFDSRGGTESRSRRRIRSGLVVGQVALALVILSGASLLARSLIRLETLPLGYGAEQLGIVQLVPPASAADSTYSAWIRMLDRALLAVTTIPGVVGVSPLLAEPFTGSNTFTTALEAEGQPASAGPTTPIVSVEAVGPGFFRTFDLPFRRGHGFTASDGAGTPAVAVVTETIARWLWPGKNPVGKRLRFVGDTTERGWRTVVGVTGDIHFRDFRAATPTVFLEYHQLAFWQGTVAVRTQGEPTAIFGQIRAAIKRVAPEMGYWQARSMNTILAGPLARPRLDAAVLVAFGVSALGLAAVGLYAVVASMVRQRRRELGIRLALGATSGRIGRLVLGEVSALVGIGMAVGLVVALTGSRLLAKVLFEVSPTDPIALLAAGALLLAAGLLAGFLPARQAGNVDPAQVLRSD